MARRKSVQQLTLGQAKRSRIAQRKAQVDGDSSVPGVPLMPQGREKRWRTTWHAEADKLLVQGKLTTADSALLEQLVDAVRGSRIGSHEERAVSHAEVVRIQAVFDARSAIVAQPEQTPAPLSGPTLQEFIASVKKERDSFEERMLPGQTIMLDSDGKPYAFPEGDALTVARDYAQAVVDGSIVSGTLEKAACARFLKNIDTGGKERGFFVDPVAARHIRDWFRYFCAFDLLPWQVLVAVDVFAFKKPSGLRLRVKLWLSVGRKNGKTAFSGGLALFCLVCDQEKFAEVYSFATMKDQARILWNDARRCVVSNPELSEYVKVQRSILLVEDTDSTFVPISSDSDTADGLRVHVGCGDECHMWKSDELVNKIVTGQLSRKQPLLFLTTTAGKSKDEGYCYTQTEIFTRFLTGQVVDDYVFDSTAAHIFCLDEGDDILDENNWHKANPSLGITEHVEHLQRLAANLKVDQNAKYSFRRDVCNLWNDSIDTGGTLPANFVHACYGYEGMPGDVHSLRASFLNEAAMHRNDSRFRAWGGADVGGIDDFFALTLIFPEFAFPNQELKLVVCNWYWTISENLDERAKRLNVPLRRWVDERWVKLAGQRFIDRMQVFTDIVEICKKYRVMDIGFDPYRADDYKNALEQERVVCTLVPQKEQILTIPCQIFMRAILGKKAVLLDPLMVWMTKNVDFSPSKHGGVKPQKPKSEEGDTKDERMKIDGVSSCCNAIQRWKNPDISRQSAQNLNDKYARMADDRANGIVHKIPMLETPWAR